MTAALELVTHATQLSRDPQHAGSPEPSGFLSLNILFKQKQGRLCKTNCREIEVAVLYPASYFSSSPSQNSVAEDEEVGVESAERLGDKESSSTEALKHPAEHPETSPISSRDEDPLSNITKAEDVFPLMSLPLELRLKIYTYLLPPRYHTIVTQLPHNGFFYNASSVPLHSAQSFYPFGTRAPNNLTTYKVLNSNFRSSFPSPSIYPEILRVSKQVKSEAEPVLYAGKGVVWDFGIHMEALKAFWGDRSAEARGMVRSVRVAREIPCLENRDEVVSKEVDPRWVSSYEFLRTELTGLRMLDLTVWSSSGSTSLFPVSASAPDALTVPAWDEDEEAEKKMREEELRRWREWEWTHDLLQMDALRQARITWWGFQSIRGENGGSNFDSWLAGRMVGDRVLRERMVWEGVAEEGVVVLRGLGE
jgi:hypothetical protein